MLNTIRAVALALIMMAFIGGGAARAQTPEAEGLGTQIAHVMFGSIGFKDLMTQELKTSGGLEIKARPEWDGFMADAAAEELTLKLPAIERMVGHAFARKFTVPEMKAGLVFLNDPNVQAGIAAEAKGSKEPTKPPGRSR